MRLSIGFPKKFCFFTKMKFRKFSLNFQIALDILGKILYNYSQFNGDDEEDTQRQCLECVPVSHRTDSFREAAVGASRLRSPAAIYGF